MFHLRVGSLRSLNGNTYLLAALAPGPDVRFASRPPSPYPQTTNAQQRRRHKGLVLVCIVRRQAPKKWPLAHEVRCFISAWVRLDP